MIHNLHICRSRGYYVGQVREAGYRRWKNATGKCRTAEAAMSRAALKMHDMKRARVLFVDSSGWYEPNVVMEARR